MGLLGSIFGSFGSSKGTTKSKQEREFGALPLGEEAFTGNQRQIFEQLGELFSQQLGSQGLESPLFARGRDLISRTAEGQRSRVRGQPNVLAGLREGAIGDIGRGELRSLSDLISQAQQQAVQNAFQFAFAPVQRGGVGVTSSSGSGRSSGTNLGFGLKGGVSGSSGSEGTLKGGLSIFG